MKKIILALLLGLGAPVLADPSAVSVRQLALGQNQTDVNVRFVVANAASQESGPLRVTLLVRPDPSAPWRVVRVWENQHLPSHGVMVKSLGSQDNRVLSGVADKDDWEARVVVETGQNQVGQRQDGFSEGAGR